MIDAQRRRSDWIVVTANALGLDNVTAVHARLEDHGHSPGPAVVRCGNGKGRSAPSPVVAELGLPPCPKIGGQLLIPRGQPSPDELEQAAVACEQLGGRIDETMSPTRARRLTASGVVIMAKIAATSPRFPPAIGRAGANSARSATHELSQHRPGCRQDGVVGCCGIEETSRGGTGRRPAPSWLSAFHGRRTRWGDGTARGRAGIGASQTGGRARPALRGPGAAS